MQRLLTPADYLTTPWKNGRGSTIEIMREPADGSDAFDFGWRVSLASVLEDGPFSAFPGIDRTIVVVEGSGMELALGPNRTHRLLPLTPFAFDGGTDVTGKLIGGPVRDFNIMVKRGVWRCEVDVLRDVQQFALPLMMPELMLLHVIDGTWHARADRLNDFNPVAQETLCLQYDRGAGYVVNGAGTAIMVRLRTVRSWSLALEAG